MPFRPMVPNRGAGLMQAGAIIGGAVANLPGQIKADKEYKYQQEQRQKALDALEQDKSLLDIQYKTFNKMYDDRADKLVQQGLMTEEQKRGYRQMFAMPKESDKLNRESLDKYLERQSSAYGKLSQVLTGLENQAKTKADQTALGGNVKSAMAGREAQFAQPEPIKGPDEETQFTETDIGPGGQPLETAPAVPGAQTQGEIARSPEIPEGTQMEDLKNVPGFATAPTEQDLEKQKRLGKKEARLQDMNDYQEAMMQYRWATHNYKKTKDEKTLQQAEDRGKQAINKLVSSIENKQIAEIDAQIKELKNPQPPSQFEDAPPIDYDAIAELETQKKNLNDQVDMLNSEKKMFGAVKKEKRAFSPTGKETSRTQGTPPPLSERQGLGGGTGQMKKGGGF